MEKSATCKEPEELVLVRLGIVGSVVGLIIALIAGYIDMFGG